jgi:hypothetical protein
MNEPVTQSEISENEVIVAESEHIQPDNHSGTRRMVIKLIAGLFILAIIIALVIFGIGKLINNPTIEIDYMNNAINQGLEQVNVNDFKEDLNIGFIDEGTMTETGQELNDGLIEIDIMLEDLNNLSDFQDFGDLNFTE